MTSGADLIAHQVNCQGVMGTGLAKQIRNVYPSVYWQYKEYCEVYGATLLGTAQILKVSNGEIQPTWIVNLFGQLKYGRDRRYTDYEALKSALEQLANYVYTTGPAFRIALPYKLGCGAAGGNWDKVLGIIQESLATVQCTVELWSLGA